MLAALGVKNYTSAPPPTPFSFAQGNAQLAMPPNAGAPSAGIGQLGLSPQELFLYQHHLGNVQSGMQLNNADGSTSTVLQMVVDGPGGKFYSIPSVWDGKALTEPEARKRAAQVGWDKWPSYRTPEEADARYMQMHDFMARDVR